MLERYPRGVASDPSTRNELGINFHPELVIVHLGANDYLGGGPFWGGPPDETFVAGYVELLQLIRSKRPRARILCLSIAPYAITGEDDAALVAKAGESLKRNIAEVLRSHT